MTTEKAPIVEHKGKPAGWGGPVAEPVQQPEPQLNEFCYVLHAPDQNDEKAAAEWRKTLPAGSKPKVVTEIKLTRLSESHSVIALYRPEGSDTLQAGARIKAADHWRREGEDGSVDTRSFLRALARTCLPAILKIRRDSDDDLGTLRLGYA